jgi:hypothetical protein
MCVYGHNLGAHAAARGRFDWNIEQPCFNGVDNYRTGTPWDYECFKPSKRDYEKPTALVLGKIKSKNERQRRARAARGEEDPRPNMSRNS